LDAKVDHPPAACGVGDQAGVVAGIGDGRHGFHESVEERAAAHVGQFAAVV
jgi:hypothetical protein